MKLILDLLGPPRLMGARTRRELRSGSLTIGRSPEADWVIPDVERLISRLHLRIDTGGDAFVLTDTSANGVFLNGGDVPVGYGASARLGNGDQIRVGDATIAATIEARAETGAAEQRPEISGIAHEGALREALRSPHDILDGPFGAIASSTLASFPEPAGSGRAATISRQAIDADWMIAAHPAPVQARETADASEPAVAVPPPFARRTPSPEVAAGRASLLRLAEGTPDLPMRRLAEAVDAAGRSMEFAVWQAFYDRVDHLVRGGQERPVDRALTNGKVVE